ncbi:unnamed protein product [Adineta steineri]|uniref:ADP-ribosylglycohydrolase n=1 Tax=Adineta steineri TaxID=433720 RepID=A0A814ZJL3_9BILA|nr:unnamed protein product [Adineta steineri]CAF3957815.1 unnamed protein product [Adineta steineri]
MKRWQSTMQKFREKVLRKPTSNGRSKSDYPGVSHHASLNQSVQQHHSSWDQSTQQPYHSSFDQPPLQQYHSTFDQPTQDRSSYPNQSTTNKPWLDLRYHDTSKTSIKKPAELENELQQPIGPIDPELLNKIQGSIVGMALGDALGAHVEFRPRQYLIDNPVTNLEGGGTWGLVKGQFTDDTSMAICLANSLISHSRFNPYDQLVRYKWWFRSGYMSSTGECFDIGAATKQSILEFEKRQNVFAKHNNLIQNDMDALSDPELLSQFDVNCSQAGVAGNGALMRLAPVPLFFHRHPSAAVEYSGISGQITHGDIKAYDACRYYGALIVAILHGYGKDQILDKQFYHDHKAWFGDKELCDEIRTIAEGSFKRKGGYDDGIRGKGYIVDALEAALWAFWSDNNSFEKGALAAVNLGDDTDTTAAIYGQLAGAHYGYKNLPKHWRKHVYAEKFLLNLSKWIAYDGALWQPSEYLHRINSSQNKVSVPAFIPTESQEVAQNSGRQRRRKYHNAPQPDPTSQFILPSSQTMNQEYMYPNDMNSPMNNQFQPDSGINAVPLTTSSTIKYITTLNQEPIHSPQSRSKRSSENNKQQITSRTTSSMSSTNNRSDTDSANQRSSNTYKNGLTVPSQNATRTDVQTSQPMSTSYKPILQNKLINDRSNENNLGVDKLQKRDSSKSRPHSTYLENHAIQINDRSAMPINESSRIRNTGRTSQNQFAYDSQGTNDTFINKNYSATDRSTREQGQGKLVDSITISGRPSTNRSTNYF